MDNFPSPVPLWPPVAPPGGGKFTTMPALASGKLYVGRDDGSIQQVSAATGTLDTSAPAGRAGTLWDPTPDFSSPNAPDNDRLDITTTEGSIRRYCIPWASATGVVPSSPFAPLALGQNAPNPFSTRTRIEYRLPADAQVEIDIFAVNGRLVRRLVRDRQPAGAHDAAWDGRDDAGRTLASGPYFYRLRTTGSDGRPLESSKKIQVLR